MIFCHCRPYLVLLSLIISLHQRNRLLTTGHSVRDRRSSSAFIQKFGFTNELRTAIVNAHNDARSNVLPKASNMWKMSWDDELATLASRYSTECKFTHNPNRQHSRFVSVGENIYLSTPAPFNTAYVKESVRAWDSEKSYYDYNTNKCMPNEVCGHYTQVVWSYSFKVGCGASKCRSVIVNGKEWTDATVLICNYGPGGNYAGRKPYVTGASCSACENPSDVCANNLCANPSRLVPPGPASWMEWSEWSQCSKSCGRDGSRSRYRICSTYVNGDCKTGPNYNSNYCPNLPLCTSNGFTPVATWSNWGSWEKCSKTCGGQGYQQRQRKCSKQGTCSGSPAQLKSCGSSALCPSQTVATWSNWGSWEKCSKTCGGQGYQLRRRVCSKQGTCSGSPAQLKTCGSSSLCPPQTDSSQNKTNRHTEFHNQDLGRIGGSDKNVSSQCGVNIITICLLMIVHFLL